MLIPEKKIINEEYAVENLQKALRFAAVAHQGQTVPGTMLPYLSHITAVSLEVISAVNKRNDIDRNLAVLCALLHDVIEDTLNVYDDISNLFGKRVADGVMALTKDGTIDKEKRMQDSLARIEKQPIEIWMVKMADRIVNLGPPPDFWGKSKIKTYYTEAKLIYTHLKSADSYLANRLKLKIKEYEKYLN